MSQDIVKELHKKIDKLKGKKEDKKELHKRLQEHKDDTEGLIELETILDGLIASGKEMPSPTDEQKEQESAKIDMDLNKIDLPENCYLEVNCEGKEKIIKLPKFPLPKPIRIRPKGEGTLKVITGKGGHKKIDRTIKGYKFTDFKFNTSTGSWIPTDKIDLH